MTESRQFFVAANHKMCLDSSSLTDLLTYFNTAPNISSNTQVVIAPATAYLQQAVKLLNRSDRNLSIASQNVYVADKGPYTGEISVPQLADIGVKWAIVGHSERRDGEYGVKESDEFVGKKVKAVLGVTEFKTQNGDKTSILENETGSLAGGAILCCGESESHRIAPNGSEDKAIDFVKGQLTAVINILQASAFYDEAWWKKVVIAYEPIWAIARADDKAREKSEGFVRAYAKPRDAQKMHAAIRDLIKHNVSPLVANSIRILYGGSVKPNTCVELASQPDIDGFLVGGASLEKSFVDIINANDQANAQAGLKS